MQSNKLEVHLKSVQAFTDKIDECHMSTEMCCQFLEFNGYIFFYFYKFSWVKFLQILCVLWVLVTFGGLFSAYAKSLLVFQVPLCFMVFHYGSFGFFEVLTIMKVRFGKLREKRKQSTYPPSRCSLNILSKARQSSKIVYSWAWNRPVQLLR